MNKLDYLLIQFNWKTLGLRLNDYTFRSNIVQ